MKIAHQLRPSSRRQSGFSFLGILIVVVIILILAGFYFGGDDKAGIDDYYNKSQEALGTYPLAKERTQLAVENVNLNAFQTQVNMWVLSHPDQPCTIEALQRDPTFQVPIAPPGFRYDIGENNEVVLVQDQSSNFPPAR